jgi:hypothetical protein
MNTITKPKPRALLDRPTRPKPKPNIQPTEKVKATLIRELPWYECSESQEHEVREISVIVPIKFTDTQVIKSIQSHCHNWTWQVLSIDRPSRKGGYDDEF